MNDLLIVCSSCIFLAFILLHLINSSQSLELCYGGLLLLLLGFELRVSHMLASTVSLSCYIPSPFQKLDFEIGSPRVAQSSLCLLNSWVYRRAPPYSVRVGFLTFGIPSQVVSLTLSLWPPFLPLSIIYLNYVFKNTIFIIVNNTEITKSNIIEIFNVVENNSPSKSCHQRLGRGPPRLYNYVKVAGERER